MHRPVPGLFDVAPRRVVLAMLAAAALVGCGGRQAAPQFSYTLLDGTRASSDALRGKVVLVNFWATRCAICVKDMPRMVATHRQFQARGFEILAVAMSYDAPASVSDFAHSRGLPFGVVIDNTGVIAKAFPGVQGTPTTFVIDKRGAIAKRIVGEPDFGALKRLVDQLLVEA